MNQYDTLDNQTGAYRISGLPEWNEIARLLNTVGRPFVAANERELSVLRRGLTKEGWKRSLYLQDAPEDELFLTGAGILSIANQWLESEIEIPGPAGYATDYFCDDGIQLVEVGDEDSVHQCPACGRTFDGKRYDSGALWFRQHKMATGCLALALVYQIERDPAYAAKAAEILRGCADAYPTDGTGLLNWSIDEAAWVIPMAQAYDLIFNAKCLSETDRETIENRLLFPIAKKLMDVPEDDSCEASWCIAAVGIVGCAVKDAGLVARALAKFEQRLIVGADPQETWAASLCFSYFTPMSAWVNLADACSRLGVDLYNHRPVPGKGMKQMFLAPISYVYPTFQVPAIGSGDCYAALPLDLYEVAYRRWGDEPFAWVLKTGYDFAQSPTDTIHESLRKRFVRSGLYAFLFGRDLPGRALKPKIATTSFNEAGVCVIQAESDTMLTLKYGKTDPCGHTDNLSMTYCTRGSLWIADYGAPGRGASIAAYYRSTMGHNTVVVDGASQKRPCHADLRLLIPGAYLQIANAALADGYPGVMHERRVIMAGDIALVQDYLTSDTDHTYDWLMRCEGDLTTKTDRLDEGKALVEEFTDVETLGEGRDFSMSWQREANAISAWISSDTNGEMLVGNAPAENALRTIPFVNYRTAGKTAQFNAIIAPGRDGVATVERIGSTFRITSGNTVDWVYMKDAAASSDTMDGFETDAQIACAREVDGVLIACGLHKGSYIKLHGETAVSIGDRFDWMEARMDSRNPIINFTGASGGLLRLRCNSRAMRVNGHRISATTADGMASIRLVGVLAKG